MFDFSNQLILPVIIVGLALIVISPATVSSTIEVSKKVFTYKIRYHQYYKKFQKIIRLHKRDQHYGVVMPVDKKLHTTLYKTEALKVPRASVAVGTVCKVINHQVLDLETHYPEVTCGGKGKGFLRYSTFAYDIILNVSSNKNTMIVTWKTDCGSDSCSTKNWLLSSKRLNRRRHYRGWMRELKQRDGFSIHPQGKYILFTVLSNHMLNGPKKSKIYLQYFASGRKQLLVSGLSPSFHPKGKLIFYRDEKGSVFVTTVTAKKPLLVFHSPYTEKDMYYKATAISWGQKAVKFIQANRLSIKFEIIDSNKGPLLLKYNINHKNLLQLLKSQ